MKALIETLRNIFRISELKNRILYTILLLAVYRLGTFIILPGIDSNILQDSFGNAGAGGNLLDLFNVFLGGAFGRGAILALGIMPYISASIVVQLLGAVLPSIQKLRTEGEAGQKKMNQITRYLTVAITFGQAISYVVFLNGQYPGAVIDSSPFFWAISILILTSGTMFLVWLGERITDNGVGNGVSLLIMIGIISGFPSALINEARSTLPMVFFIEILALGVVTMAVVALTQATRKIPVNYARQMMGNRIGQLGRGNAARQYIPLKVNSAGVMPIIFAQAIMFVPTTLIQLSGSESLTPVAAALGDFTGFWYNFIFFFMIIAFTYFYTAITVNPNEIADQLKRNGGFIPGVKPGKRTANYIDTVLSRITLPGSVFLAFVSIFPAFAMIMGISQNFAQFFGGTTLLIMIGVILDTLQQIESYLLMRHYDGLMQSGRVKGRSRRGIAV
ncbi:MAG: preprotein translocase subunit SecY [Bacteroidetes bacterium]|nr:preprotein translocase subunit SecY [Bacteroidota bacterium]MCB0841698.1 preprotein translocase subunit SecY [Bacteroidota bacterium]